MKDKLTEEEVLRVAKLAKIAVSDKETMEKYQYNLKALIDSLDVLKDLEVESNEKLSSPSCNETKGFNDEAGEMITINELSGNAPRVKGNFVEVPVMINE